MKEPIKKPVKFEIFWEKDEIELENKENKTKKYFIHEDNTQKLP